MNWLLLWSVLVVSALSLLAVLALLLLRAGKHAVDRVAVAGDRMRAAQEQALPPHLSEVRPVDVDGGAAAKAQLREVRRVNAVRRVERRQLRRQAAWDRWLSGRLRSVSASGSRHTSGKNPVREVR